MGSAGFPGVLTVLYGMICIISSPDKSTNQATPPPHLAIHTGDLEKPPLPVAVQHKLPGLVWQPLL